MSISGTCLLAGIKIPFLMEGSSTSSLYCQRCWISLKVMDHGFNDYFDEHSLAELSLPAIRTPELDLSAQANNLDVCLLPKQKVSSNQGFTLIDKSQFSKDNIQNGHLSYHLQKSIELFDLVSSTSDIDHPLCDECADTLVNMLQHQLSAAEDESREYQQYLSKLTKEQNQLDTSTNNLATMERELASLQLQEKELESELIQLIEQQKELQKQVQDEEKETTLSKENENSYRRILAAQTHQQLKVKDEILSYECHLNFVQLSLNQLKYTNAFNASFHLWHTGHFGTINGLRLGRLPSVPIDWTEINAAWGQAVVLLSAMARKVNITFKRYKLIPFGCQSCIEDTVENKILPLYGSGGFKLLWDAKFDNGMVAFLDCLQQFQLEVENSKKLDDESNRLNFQFPYR